MPVYFFTSAPRPLQFTEFVRNLTWGVVNTHHNNYANLNLFIYFWFNAGLIENGDFEKGPKASDLKGTEVIGRYAIPRWEISGFVEYIKAGQKQGDMLLVVPEGACAVRLGNEAYIKQRLNVTKAKFYSLTFCAARTCAQEERLNVSVPPDSGLLPIQTLYGSNGWDCYSWAFLAPLDQVEVIIHNPGVEEDPACGPLIDTIAIKELLPPKPTSGKFL